MTIFEFWQDYTLIVVLLGAMVLGICTGSLGCFAVLRRQSLLGDAVSHASLPGIAIAYLLTGHRDTWVLLLGAAIAGWVGTLVILKIIRGSRVKEDSALGIVLSVFFGLGLLLLTWIQRMPGAGKAGLDRFLFGQAATLVESDVRLMLVLSILALGCMLLFWKEFKILSFDRAYARTLGIPVERVEFLLTILLVIAIVIGLQTVGVVLMSAMLIAPAAAARQWTDRLGTMVFLAALIGALGGASGVLISSSVSHMPTGPTVVLCASILVALSLMFAPQRGIVWRWFRFRRNRRLLGEEMILYNMLQMALHHKDDLQHPHLLKVIQTMNPVGDVRPKLRTMEEAGWVKNCGKGCWSLSSAGIERARQQGMNREVESA